MKIDTARSEATFSLKKLGLITVRGQLKDMQGEIIFSADNPAGSSFNVCVGTASISTGNPKRDEHLRNEDFFAVAEFPTVCFRSTLVERQGEQFRATGDLTIRGTTKRVVIPFGYTDGQFTGELTINRADFGLGKKFPGFFVGKHVQITILSTVE
ncbi:MAG: YceI family protein [Bacteroidota bacterium]